MTKKTGVLAGAAACLALTLSLIACPPPPELYSAIDDLPNPGRGWTTFYSVNGDETNDRYPPSTIAYYRFTWRQAEPVEGQIAFDQIDAMIADARASGQRFAFRVMPDVAEGGLGIPDWLRARVDGWAYTGDDLSACFMPDFSDPDYLDAAARLVAALGARYNGNADIDHVDIGLVGHYGEWHTSQASAVAAGAVMPPLAVRRQYIDMFADAFPDTPLLMLVGDLTQDGVDALAYAVSRGAGWRADSWGDYRSGWNHMENFYPSRIADAVGASEAWRTTPIALESWGVPANWQTLFANRLDEILDFAVRYHVSILNGKSNDIPAAWVEQFTEFTTHIGYRFALTATPTLPASAARGSSFTIVETWRNHGNAPIYRPYSAAIRLVSGGTERARGVSTADVQTWMPYSADATDYTASYDITVPADAPTGAATLQTALLDPVTNQPAIRFPMEGAQPDLWYDVGSVLIE